MEKKRGIFWRVREWYRGKPPRNDGVVFMLSRDRPWLAHVIDAIASYVAREYKWLIGLAIAVAMLVVAALKLT